MTYKDYYGILDISPDATEDMVRAAFKQLAKQYHPDRNPGNAAAEARFKELVEARDILLDSAHRQAYDQLRRTYEQATRAGAKAGPGGLDINQIFTAFFEGVYGSSAARQPKQGKHYEAHISISLAEACKGVTEIISYEGKRLRMVLQPGIRDGQVLRIREQGGPGRHGGPPGDLLLTIRVKPQEGIIRQDDNLQVTARCDLYTAVLGGSAIVETPGNRLSVTIPAGSQPGDLLKVPGRGMPVYGRSGVYGDLYVQVQVSLPTRLTPEEQALFRQLQAMRT
ncbi:MAG: DnaJ C-terminal domain-containing protein [Bacteroidia bacterium]|nr:DnaJ C-terminal domain-containing protein [Bacteroidia bacterium]